MFIVTITELLKKYAFLSDHTELYLILKGCNPTEMFEKVSGWDAGRIKLRYLTVPPHIKAPGNKWLVIFQLET